MSNGLKVTFLIHAIVAFLFGLGLYFVPGTFAAMVGWGAMDPIMARNFGGALLAIGVSSWLGYRAKDWGQVRIVVVMEIFLTVLSVLSNLYAQLMAGGPMFNWSNVVVVAIFAVLWIYFYAKAPKA